MTQIQYGYKLTPAAVSKTNKKQQRILTGCAIIGFLLFFLFLLIVGLSKKNSYTSVTPQRDAVLVDVDNLAKQNAAYVDRILGAPSEVTPIRRYSLYSSMMPGEFRYYRLSDGSAVNVQFYKGQAKWFSIYFSSPANSPLSAVMRCGFGTSDLGGLQRSPLGRTWTQVQTENARYRRVTVGGTTAGEYTVFQAEVY